MCAMVLVDAHLFVCRWIVVRCLSSQPLRPAFPIAEAATCTLSTHNAPHSLFHPRCRVGLATDPGIRYQS